MTLAPPRDQDIVIFGGTGDLAQRKLLPALFSLCARGSFCEQGQIICLARSELDDERIRALARNALDAAEDVDFDESCWASFSRRVFFIRLDEEGYKELAKRLRTPERLIYLAVPPDSVPDIVDKLGEAGLVEGSRLVIEKPFGTDLASAQELNRRLHKVFPENQVFRIDHYLGKETVQNIMVFRFGNAVYERVWNRDAIQRIEITVAESIGVEGRGSFYEGVGALRDVLQSHLLQMLAIVTMEAPIALDEEPLRDEKAKLLSAIRPIDPSKVVRGQYLAGVVDAKAVPGYREEANVTAESEVETYIAVRVEIDNWRWAGVPIYLRTGKRLPRRATEVEIVFRDVPVSSFKPVRTESLHPNRLTLRIQPEEGITFEFLAKVPGPELEVREVGMEFHYEQSFMAKPAEAYIRLVHDAMNGDPTLFVRQDEIERSWAIVQPILDNPSTILPYKAGEWGPWEADKLVPGGWYLR